MKFITQLNRSFGRGGGFTCAFIDSELTRFIQFLKRRDRGVISIAKGTVLIGQQPSSSVWVFNENTQITRDGTLNNTTESYVWTPACLTAMCDKVTLAEIVPEISTTMTTDHLPHLVDLLESACKHNFLSALLMLGGAIMSFHYEQVAGMYGGCPIVTAIGPTETGKSTSIRAALSLFGMTKDSKGFYVEGSYAYFLERSALSCLPYGIDEVCTTNKQFDFVKFVVDLYGGAKTANLRRGSLMPHSIPLIATNFKVKDDPRYIIK